MNAWSFPRNATSSFVHVCKVPFLKEGFLSNRLSSADRYSSVGIATRYGPDGPGIESREGRDFPDPSRPALRTTQLPIKWGPGLFPWVKRLGRGVDHPSHLVPKVKERVELCLYSPSGPSWPVIE